MKKLYIKKGYTVNQLHGNTIRIFYIADITVLRGDNTRLRDKFNAIVSKSLRKGPGVGYPEGEMSHKRAFVRSFVVQQFKDIRRWDCDKGQDLFSEESEGKNPVNSFPKSNPIHSYFFML